jgi:hypothetical protein
VIGPDGKPVSGASAAGVRSYFLNWEHEPLESDQFAVIGLKLGQPRRVLVLHRSLKLAGSTVVEGDGPVTIRLQPWATLAGRLVGADGRPMAETKLSFDHLPGRNDPSVATHPDEVRTDADGRFRFDGLIPSLTYYLDFVGKLTLKPGEARDLGDVRAPTGEP